MCDIYKTTLLSYWRVASDYREYLARHDSGAPEQEPAKVYIEVVRRELARRRRLGLDT